MMQGVECLAELKQKKQFDDHLNKKKKRIILFYASKILTEIEIADAIM